MTLEPSFSPAAIGQLAALLERRLDVIADTAWRDRDAAGQWAALREVSEALDAFRMAHGDVLPKRLSHFLDQSSFGKALDWVKEYGNAAASPIEGDAL
jgi:hypothetical protein